MGTSIQGEHKCPTCGKTILDSWGYCPYCRGPFLKNVNNQNNPAKSNNALSLKGCLIFFFALFTIGYFISSIKSCGGKPSVPHEIVYNSEWDASVSQVEKYLKSNLKDPDSYESIEWSKVFDLGAIHETPHRFYVRHKYRAKNSFGGYVVDNKVFYLDDNGEVISIKEFYN